MVIRVGFLGLRVIVVEWSEEGKSLVVSYPGIAVDVGDERGSQNQEPPHYLIVILQNTHTEADI